MTVSDDVTTTGKCMSYPGSTRLHMQWNVGCYWFSIWILSCTWRPWHERAQSPMTRDQVQYFPHRTGREKHLRGSYHQWCYTSLLSDVTLSETMSQQSRLRGRPCSTFRDPAPCKEAMSQLIREEHLLSLCAVTEQDCRSGTGPQTGLMGCMHIASMTLRVTNTNTQAAVNKTPSVLFSII